MTDQPETLSTIRDRSKAEEQDAIAAQGRDVAAAGRGGDRLGHDRL